MEKYENALHGILSALLILLSIVANPAQAVTLSFGPTTQSVAPGGTAAVDINISGLGNFAAPSLGAFLVEVTFDSSILSFDSVSYGAFLGDPADHVETDIITTVGSGSVSLDEFSFLFDFELDALQPADFTLATLKLSADAVGTSPLGYGAIDLSDAVGSTIVPTLETGDITVVPLPASLPLFLSALGCLFGIRRISR